MNREQIISIKYKFIQTFFGYYIEKYIFYILCSIYSIYQLVFLIINKGAVVVVIVW